LCPVRQTNITWTAESLDSHQVAVYFRDKTNLQTICPGHARHNQDLQGHHVLNLTADCSLTGMDLRINARTDILLQVPVATHPKWDTDELLVGRTPKEILEVRRHLQQRNVHPADEVEHMLQQEAAITEEGDDEDWDAAHRYALYVAAALVVVTGLFLLYRYGRMYIRVGQNYVNANSAAQGAMG
jgi:hypothetical protein